MTEDDVLLGTDLMKTSVQANRAQLLSGEKVQCVEPDEFVQLLVSRQPLRREDDAPSLMCILRDLTSGIRYLLPEEQLHARATGPCS